MQVVSSFFGGSFTAKESVEEGAAKFNFQYIDPIASVLGLAQLAIMEEQGAKISLRNGTRLAPLYPSDAAEVFTPKILTASELPQCFQNASLGLLRYRDSDSREELVFYNYALPFVARLYTADSVNENQKKAMEQLWKLVKSGIETLEQSYGAQLKEPLSGKLNRSAVAEVSLKDELNDEYIEISVEDDLPLKSDLAGTFASWKEAINGYCKPVHSPLHLKDITYSEAGEESPLKEDTAEKKKNSKTESCPNPLKINSKNGKNGTNDSSDIELEDKKELQATTKASNLEELLKMFGERLAAFKIQNPEQEKLEIINDLHQFVEKTLAKQKVPKKLSPLSEKIKQLWSINDIQEILNKFEEMKEMKKINRKTPRVLKVEELNKTLDEKSHSYKFLVAKEFNEVLTL